MPRPPPAPPLNLTVPAFANKYLLFTHTYTGPAPCLINGSASGSATRIQMYLRVLVSWLLRCFLCLCCSLLLSLFDYNLRHSAANICTPPLPLLLLWNFRLSVPPSCPLQLPAAVQNNLPRWRSTCPCSFLLPVSISPFPHSPFRSHSLLPARPQSQDLPAARTNACLYIHN